MTKSIDKPDDPSRSPPPSNGGPSTGRRALLVAMPTIFSLRQGVAAEMARTSAVLVKSSPDTLLCAKDPGLGGNDKGWFAPDTGQIDVTKFTSGRTYCKFTGINPTNNKPQYASTTTSEMCDNGGRYYYSPNDNCNNTQNLVEKNVNGGVRGAFVSALSIASFGARVNITEV